MSYFLRLLNSFLGVFGLDAATGVLILKRRPSSSLPERLVVRASDRGAPSRSSIAVVRLQVKRSNNHAPHFAISLYLARVREDAPVGTAVFDDIHATDADDTGDGNVYAAVTYSLSGSSLFDIDARTGRITTAGSLDVESTDTIHLTVTATDGGDKKATTHAQVRTSVKWYIKRLFAGPNNRCGRVCTSLLARALCNASGTDV